MGSGVEAILEALESVGYHCTVDQENLAIMAKVRSREQSYEVILRIFPMMDCVTLGMPRYIWNLPDESMSEVMSLINLLNPEMHEIQLELEDGKIQLNYQHTIS